MKKILVLCCSILGLPLFAGTWSGDPSTGHFCKPSSDSGCKDGDTCADMTYTDSNGTTQHTGPGTFQGRCKINGATGYKFGTEMHDGTAVQGCYTTTDATLPSGYSSCSS